jgi:peptidoglycan/xylan/chitin deacetylase (PgdA/CDA1 family)
LIGGVVSARQSEMSLSLLANEGTWSGWDGTFRQLRVPILSYHYVSQPPPDADEERLRYSISPETFRQHIDTLFYQGYTPLSLYELHDALMVGNPLPAKPVVLTFDGSYTDHYQHVFPTLQRRSFRGTFFVITGLADSNDPSHMNWEQIIEMSNAGMYMESMTKTYPDLRDRGYDFLIYELVGSAESLFAYTGRVPRMFAYPMGVYDDSTQATLRSMGVLRAVTYERGVFHTTDNIYALQRLEITNRVGVSELEDLLGEE